MRFLEKSAQKRPMHLKSAQKRPMHLKSAQCI